ELGDDVARGCVDYVPMRAFEGWYVEDLAVGRQGHAVAAAFEGFVPDDFLRHQIDGCHAGQRAHVEPACTRVGGDSFDVFGLLAGWNIPGRDALDEFVSVVNVENENADAAVVDVVSDARFGDVKQMLLFGGGGQHQSCHYG